MTKTTNPDNIRFVMEKVNRAVNPYGDTNLGALGLFDLAVTLLNEIPALPDGPEVESSEPVKVEGHDNLVQAAIRNPEVMQHMRDGKMIYAIKVLRQATLAGLKESKDACEDQRVRTAKNWGPSTCASFTV